MEGGLLVLGFVQVGVSLAWLGVAEFVVKKI